jgi:hypothetical protein
LLGNLALSPTPSSLSSLNSPITRTSEIVEGIHNANPRSMYRSSDVLLLTIPVVGLFDLACRCVEYLSSTQISFHGPEGSRNAFTFDKIYGEIDKHADDSSGAPALFTIIIVQREQVAVVRRSTACSSSAAVSIHESTQLYA